MRRIFLTLMVLTILATVFSGCTASGPQQSSEASGTPASNTPETNGALSEEDAAYAGPIADNILAGIAGKDYEAFSRDFSDTMKSALTKDAFDSLVSLLETKIGDYQSKTFSEAANVTQNGVVYTVVIYTAKYSDEPGGVLITVAFSGEEGAKRVEQLFFNSPKLREQ